MLICTEVATGTYSGLPSEEVVDQDSCSYSCFASPTVPMRLAMHPEAVLMLINKPKNAVISALCKLTAITSRG